MLFLRALFLLPVVSLSLKLRGFQATRGTLQKILSAAAPQPSSDAVSQGVTLTARIVNAADRHGLFPSSCLAKSLTLWWLLGRQGITSSLRIGIRKENEKLQAHAWVEREGIALNEPEERHRHYAAFDAALASFADGQR